MNKLIRVGIIATFISLVACGGGGGSKTTPPAAPALSSSPAISSSSVVPSSAAASSFMNSSLGVATQKGFLVDGIVANAQYYTNTIGTALNPFRTEADGVYRYLPSENVTFLIGGIVFPTIAAKPTVTLLDIFSTTDPDDQRVRNAARLLLTIDKNANAADGIQIDFAAIAAATTVDFSLSDTAFASSTAVVNLIANSGAQNTTLVSAATATSHVASTLASGVNTRTTLTSTGANAADARPAFNAAFGGTAVEAQECRTDVVDPIRLTEVMDTQRNKNVFAFSMIRDTDLDCTGTTTGRQRLEVKTYNPSPENLKAVVGEWTTYRWKFKLPSGFQSSNRFTHIFQLKPVDGDDGDPVITLTTRKGSPDKLELIHDANDLATPVKVETESIAPFLNKWVDAHVRIHHVDNNGYVEVTIRDLENGNVLLSYYNDNIDMFRDLASFNRPKWGIYRELQSIADLRDETVLFDDFCIAEGTNICPAPSFNLTPSSSSVAASSAAASSLSPIMHSYTLNSDGNDSVGSLNLNSTQAAAAATVIFTNAGINGNAATFSGANYLTNSSTTFGFVPSSTYSIEFWVRFTALPASSTSSITTVLSEQINVAGDLGGFRVYAKTNTTTNGGATVPVFRVLGDVGAQVEATSTTALSTATWYHIVAVYDAGAMTLYLNGTSTATATYVPGAAVRISPLASDNFSVGGGTTSPSATNKDVEGSMDSVKVYRVALTATEVLNNFNNP